MKLALLAALLALYVPSARAETIRFYHPDIQGNLVAMTDDNGQVVWRAEPGPFAKNTSHPPDHPQRFLDQPQEPNGLFEIGARWYDPDFGRFMTPDPAPFTTADLVRPGAMNRYAYGLNNPYRLQDSSGADPVETTRPAQESGLRASGILSYWRYWATLGESDVPGEFIDPSERTTERIPLPDPSEEITERIPITEPIRFPEDLPEPYYTDPDQTLPDFDDFPTDPDLEPPSDLSELLEDFPVLVTPTNVSLFVFVLIFFYSPSAE